MARRTDALIACLLLALGIAIGIVYRKAYDDAGGMQDLPTLVHEIERRRAIFGETLRRSVQEIENGRI